MAEGAKAAGASRIIGVDIDSKKFDIGIGPALIQPILVDLLCDPHLFSGSRSRLLIAENQHMV